MANDLMEIFKIQLPLASNEPDPPALIYNESRSIERKIRVDQIEDLFAQGETRIYIEGTVNEDGEIEFHKFVSPRDW